MFKRWRRPTSLPHLFILICKINSSAYEIGTPEDVYNGFRQAVSEDFEFVRDYPNVDVGAIFDSWVQNPGAPVINVNVNTDTGLISLTQVRI